MLHLLQLVSLSVNLWAGLWGCQSLEPLLVSALVRTLLDQKLAGVLLQSGITKLVTRKQENKKLHMYHNADVLYIQCHCLTSFVGLEVTGMPSPPSAAGLTVGAGVFRACEGFSVGRSVGALLGARVGSLVVGSAVGS